MKRIWLIAPLIFTSILVLYFVATRPSHVDRYRAFSIGLSCADSIDVGQKKIFPRPHENHAYGVKENECVDLDSYSGDMVPENISLFGLRDDPDDLCVVIYFSKKDADKIFDVTNKEGRGRYVTSVEDSPYVLSYLDKPLKEEFEICTSRERAYKIRRDFILDGSGI